MSGTVTLEYVGTDRAPRPRWHGIAGAALVLVVLAVVGVLWWSDAVRRSAVESLSSGYVDAVAIAGAGERSVQGTLAYASPMIWSASVSEDVRSSLRSLVESSAADVAVELTALRADVAATRLLPWHEEQRGARDALLALVDAQVARFAGIAEDVSDIDLVLAGGPLPTGAAASALRAAGGEVR